jgi:broad specificity phosphatase PhoE
MQETFKHLVLVRHGESEGDVRREAWRHGETVPVQKLPEDEELTAKGAKQSRLAGLWIQKHILDAYKLSTFDGCYVSSAQRSLQTAVALELPNVVWQEDRLLDERNRGKIRGLHPGQHKALYPTSFEEMERDPLHWSPPGGETFIPGVVGRVSLFFSNVQSEQTVLAVTHRDWIWAAQLILENLGENELLAVDTDEIRNAQIVHYTSVSPETNKVIPGLFWKRSVDSSRSNDANSWQQFSQIK